MDRKQEDMIRDEMMAEQAVARMNQRLRWPMAEDARRSLVNSIMRTGSPEQFLFSPEPYRPAPPFWSIGGLIARALLFIRSLRGDESARPNVRAATLASLHYAVKRSGAPGLIVIFLVAIFLTTPVGLPDPFEVVIQSARNKLELHPVPGKIILVTKDDPRTGQMGTWTRAHDAMLVDRLRELGVSRMAFNEIMSRPTDAKDDALLAAAFDRAGGKVILGALPPHKARVTDPNAILPYPLFRQRTTASHFEIYNSWFSHVSKVIGAKTINGREYPSMLALLAGQPDYKDDVYPDYSYDLQSIKSIPAIDVLNRKVDPAKFANMPVFVSHVDELNNKRALIPGQTQTAVAYAFIMAVETLMAGPPLRLGWWPTMLLAFAFGIACVLTVQRRRRAMIVAVAMISCFAFALLLDRFNVHVKVAPALIGLTILAFREGLRSKGIEAMMTNAITGLPNLAHLDEIKGRGNYAIVAVKVERFRDFIANRPFADQRVLLNSIVARINIVAPDCIVHQGDDGLFVFLVSPKSDVDIANLPELLLALFTQDVVGLHSLQRIGISVGLNNDSSQAFDIRLALAIERATVSAYITPYAIK